jgi:hypothetical protein
MSKSGTMGEPMRHDEAESKKNGDQARSLDGVDLTMSSTDSVKNEP